MEKMFVENRGHVYTHAGFSYRGWHSEENIRVNRKLAEEVHNGQIVEIGVFGGASIFSIIDICIKNSTKITGIDPWELLVPADEHGSKLSNVRFRKENLEDAHNNLQMICDELNYNEHVKLIKNFSHLGVNQFEDKSIDLLYIDGEHTYNAVTLDLNLWFPKMKDGSTIWGDDFWKGGVKKAVADFCKDKNLKFIKDKNSFIIRL